MVLRVGRTTARADNTAPVTTEEKGNLVAEFNALQIAIVTGEASGDRVGAQLCQEIKRLCPDACVWGTGGQFMRDAGAEVVIDASRWGVIGISSAVKILPQILVARARLFKILRARKPDVVVAVDAGAFNLGFGPIEGMCVWLRRTMPETKILYYFPPGSWRRTLKGTRLDTLADAVATPFSWSADELNRLGANAVWVGHPLLDLVKPSRPLAEFNSKYGLNPDHPTVGLLPGSRTQEIHEVLPIMFRAASVIARRVPGAQFVLGLAPTVDRADVVKEWERVRQEAKAERAEPGERAGAYHGNSDKTRLPVGVPVGAGSGGSAPDALVQRQRDWLRRAEETTGQSESGDFPLVIVENETYDVMAASDALLITSGTATLEAAILGKPMVITYRFATSLTNRLQYAVVKKRLPEFFGLPNLLAQKKICPELIQDDATPTALADEIIGLLLEPERMLTMRADLREAVAQLGEPGGAARTAQMVFDLANGTSPAGNNPPREVVK